MYDFDLFVIGAGSGGLAASKNAAKLGKKVAVAENDLVGGTCVIRGCVPKKIMSYAASYAESFTEGRGYGFSEENIKFDFAAFAHRRNAEIARLNEMHVQFLEKAGVTLVEGHATLVDAHTVSVGDAVYTAEKILLATGSTPVRLDIPGEEHTLISDDIWHLSEKPESLVVIGGGYIGVEFASIFNALGVKVTVVIRKDLVLRGFDEDVRAHVQDELKKRGVTFLTEEEPESFENEVGGTVLTHLKSGKKISSTIVLTATGRHPNTRTLGLEKVGVKLDTHGAVVVDKFLKTSVENIYAVGDMVNRVALTPVAIKHGRMVTNNLYLGTETEVDDHAPSAVFTAPPVGVVGLTEKEAVAQLGKKGVDVYVSDFKPMKHQLSDRDERSFMKMIVCKKTDKVLGLHMVGQDAPEIIQGFAVAVRAGLTKADFDATVAVHPSSAEEFVLMR